MGERESQVTYTSGTASVSSRASASEFNRAVPILRTTKRNVRAVPCARTGDFTQWAVKPRPEPVGQEALEEMFVASRPKFVAIAYSILRNKEDAEDAVQNAFLSGYRHLRGFEGRSALKTWFTRIVLNAALMLQRQRKPFAVLPLSQNSDSPEINWVETISDPERDPETAHAEQEIIEYINGILLKMKPKLRQAFTMTYFDELSGQEACARLGVSTGTFKARIFRARRELLHQAHRTFLAPIQRMHPPNVPTLENRYDSGSAAK
jgi:RNA polymerase sigma-70 factor, ECF subfamily